MTLLNFALFIDCIRYLGRAFECDFGPEGQAFERVNLQKFKYLGGCWEWRGVEASN